MKIWEVHALQFSAPVRTTPEGLCDIDGLLMSEKAYLLALRDMRPPQLFAMVTDLGAANASAELLNYYGSPAPGQAGHSLIPGRSRRGDPVIMRSDEVRLPAREYVT